MALEDSGSTFRCFFIKWTCCVPHRETGYKAEHHQQSGRLSDGTRYLHLLRWRQLQKGTGFVVILPARQVTDMRIRTSVFLSLRTCV